MWGAVYLVRTGDLMLTWEQPVLGAGGWNVGDSCEMVGGRYALRVMNPTQFLQTIYRRLHDENLESGSMKSFRLSRPEQESQRFATKHLANGRTGSRCLHSRMPWRRCRKI